MANDASPDPPFRLKLLPIAVTVVLGFGLPYLAAFAAIVASKYAATPSASGPVLPWLYSQHAFQIARALIAIFIMKAFVPANYGLRWPEGKTYISHALLWGVFFGGLMTIVDYAPQLLAHTTPRLDYPLTSANAGGWLFFEGVYVGPTEEIPFRALLVTYLATTMPGRLRVAGLSMNWAGVIVAAIFALLHATSFFSREWPLAIGQQIYAFALGVLYAYWLEKSGSVVAPAIGHNVGDFVEYAIVFAWISLAH
jgi:hypothetical protein